MRSLFELTFLVRFSGINGASRGSENGSGLYVLRIGSSAR